MSARAAFRLKKTMPILTRHFSLAFGLILSAALSGCGDKPASAPPAAGMPPPEVAVITVAAESVTISAELPGRLEATRVAQVRARVPGIVQKRLFREGGEVKAGDVLFQIDPAQYKANLASAEAALARAEANLTQTTAKAQRYQPLVESNAISKQEYDDATAARMQASADVAAAKAARETARLNLGYATVSSPISGRIGRALVTEGALVGQGEATQLAVVQQIDPIYVTLTQSSNDMENLQRALAEGKLKRLPGNGVRVTLVTQDGRPYGEPGKLLFSDISVDESSGAVILRGVFPNPARSLLPGMYVRARLEQAVREQSIMVPQQAVQRTGDKASVLVVLPDGKVEARPIRTEGSLGDQWIVSAGLKPGEKVIVEGLQKARPGASVKPVQWQKPGAAPAPASAGPAPATPATPAAPAASAAASKPAPQTK